VFRILAPLRGMAARPRGALQLLAPLVFLAAMVAGPARARDVEVHDPSPRPGLFPRMKEANRIRVFRVTRDTTLAAGYRVLSEAKSLPALWGAQLVSHLSDTREFYWSGESEPDHSHPDLSVWLASEWDTCQLLVDFQNDEWTATMAGPSITIGSTVECRRNLLQLARAAFPADTGFRGFQERPPASQSPEALGEGDVEPVLLKAEPMIYPREARRDGLEGRVLSHAQVGVDGRVRQIVLVRGDPNFNATVVDAISEYVFRPAKRKGVVVPAWVAIPINFRLHN
jgi:TonB family protein